MIVGRDFIFAQMYLDYVRRGRQMNKSKKIIKEQGLAKPDKKEVKKEATSRKYLVLIIIGVLVILGGVFVACYTQLRPRPILTVEGPGEGGENETHTVYYKDAMYDIYTVETMYNSYGMDWDNESGEDGETLADTTKTSIMDDMIEREILIMQAEKDGTTLADEDKTETEETVSTTMSNMSDNAKKLRGLSESDVRKAVEKRKLAEKEKQVIIDGFDIDDDAITAGVSKTDFRQYTLQYYMISKKDTDENGESVDKDADAIAKAKTDMEALRKKALSADSFEGLITDSDNDSKDDETSAQFADHKLIETDEDFLTEDLRKQVKKMANDDISEVLETDEGFYVIKMVNNNDSEAYDNEVKSQIETEENNQYQTYYDETLKPMYTTKIKSYWKDRVELGGITV